MLSFPERTTYPAPDPKLASQWRGRAADREVREVEARVGVMLSERGYEPCGLPALEVGQFRAALLALESRALGFRFRVRRYGFAVAAADAIARRWGPERLRRYLRDRIFDVDAAFVR